MHYPELHVLGYHFSGSTEALDAIASVSPAADNQKLLNLTYAAEDKPAGMNQEELGAANFMNDLQEARDAEMLAGLPIIENWKKDIQDELDARIFLDAEMNPSGGRHPLPFPTPQTGTESILAKIKEGCLAGVTVANPEGPARGKLETDENDKVNTQQNEQSGAALVPSEIDINSLSLLIPLDTDNPVEPHVDARDLWREIQSKQQFADWMKNRVEEAGLTLDEDYGVIHKFTNNPQGGRPAKEYWLTLDAAKHIAMLEGNVRGKLIRSYFIACGKELRKRMTAPILDLNDPDSVLDELGRQVAAHRAVRLELKNSQGQVKKLEEKADGLLDVSAILAKDVKARDEENAVLRPKVGIYDEQHRDKEALYLTSQMAANLSSWFDVKLSESAG